MMALSRLLIRLFVMIQLSACASASSVQQLYSVKHNLYEDSAALFEAYWDIRTSVEERFIAWSRHADSRLKWSLATKYLVTNPAMREPDEKIQERILEVRSQLGETVWKIINRSRLNGLSSVSATNGEKLLSEGETNFKSVLHSLPEIAWTLDWQLDEEKALVEERLDPTRSAMKEKDSYFFAMEDAKAVAAEAMKRFQIDLFGLAGKTVKAAEEKKLLEALRAAYATYQGARQKAELPDLLSEEHTQTDRMRALANKLVEITEATTQLYTLMNEDLDQAFLQLEKIEMIHLATLLIPQGSATAPNSGHAIAYTLGKSHLSEIASVHMLSRKQDRQDLAQLKEIVIKFTHLWDRILSIHDKVARIQGNSLINHGETPTAESISNRDFRLPIAVARHVGERSKMVTAMVERALAPQLGSISLGDKLLVIHGLEAGH